MNALVIRTHRYALLCTLLLLALAAPSVLADGQGDPPSGKKANDRSTIGISGYLQTEYLNGTAPPAAGPLALRRARITLKGNSRDRVDGRIQYAFDRFRPALCDLYVTGYTPDLSLRVGQFEVPFSEDVMASNASYEPLETPPVLNRLFPAERDRGVVLTHRPRETHGTQLSAGVLLGNGINRWDNNASKDILVRAKQFFDGGRGSAFAGVQTGQFTDAANATTQRLYYGAGAAWTDRDKDWDLNTEAWMGQALGTPFRGGFVRAIRNFSEGEHRVYAQVDYLDPDVGAAADAQVGPLAGYIWQAGNDTKLTFELNGRQSQVTPGADFGVGMRCQVDFD